MLAAIAMTALGAVGVAASPSPARGADLPATAARLPTADKGWHSFTLSWTQKQLTWWFDGRQVYTTTTGVPQQAMYLIMNLADDDTQGGCPGSFYVQSVNVWVPKS